MSPRYRSATVVACFVAIPWILESCGRAANVLDEELREAPDGSANGFGGGVTGTGGFAPSTGGVSSGGVRNDAGGSPAGGGGGPSQYEALRDGNSRALCEIPLEYPCLTYSFSQYAMVNQPEVSECTQQTTARQLERYGTRCWTEWSAHVACALQRTDYCPCGDGGACTFNPWTDDFGPSCQLTRLALDQCYLGSEAAGSVSGPAGVFDWMITGDECTVSGKANDEDQIRALCTGGAAGPHSCICLVNGVPLDDVFQLDRGTPVTFTAPDCRSVASAVASGECVGALQCCFEHNATGTLRCDCADSGGVCAALLMGFSAQLVDHCPRYRSP